MPETPVKKKIKAKNDEKEQEATKEDAADKEEEEEEQQQQGAPAKEKKKKKFSKKAKSSQGFLDGTFGNIFFLALACGIGYCRYNGINIPFLDDIIRKFRGEVFGGGGGWGGSAEDSTWSLEAVRSGKPMAVGDLEPQIRRYCGRWAKCSAEYWEALPDVAAALKRGPGTWDRKPLKKTEARDIDGVLVKVAGRPEARQKANWEALRAISKELFDVTPKSIKESLACRMTLKSATPPDDPSKSEEVPVDDTVVDDLP